MHLNIPLAKVDEAKRLVYGIVTAEQPDNTGEICDYASSKPYYQRWSAGFAELTDGRSLGNLRVMHGNVVAGKLTAIDFDDDAAEISICAKITDDNIWSDVLDGVYTGFSHGGKYAKRWPDPKNPRLTRYTACPVEISIVDSPCLPGATFAIVKADGSMELRKFVPPPAADAPARSLVKIVDEMQRAARSLYMPAVFAKGRPTLKDIQSEYAVYRRNAAVFKRLLGELHGRVSELMKEPLPIGTSTVSREFLKDTPTNGVMHSGLSGIYLSEALAIVDGSRAVFNVGNKFGGQG